MWRPVYLNIRADATTASPGLETQFLSRLVEGRAL
jgi:hypothetical protein